VVVLIPLANQINPHAKFLFAHPNKYVFLTQEPIIFININYSP
jgi:hypothetical protein